MAASEAPEQRSDAGHLLIAHRDGDAFAFAKLVETYRRPVYGYLVHGGVADADRDDVFQDVFIKIHRASHQFQEGRALHPWLFTIVANTVRSHLRKQRLRRLFFTEPTSSEPTDPAPDSESTVSAKQSAAWLTKAIEALPVTQRQVLVLVSTESLPLKDVAAALGLPLNTVKTHLRRARLRLAESLGRRQTPVEIEKTS